MYLQVNKKGLQLPVNQIKDFDQNYSNFAGVFVELSSLCL